MEAEEIRKKDAEYIMHTYGRLDLVAERGSGCILYDVGGKKYLDFLGGIACATVGHGNKEVSEAIAKQAQKLIHVSNYYYTEPQVALAEKLSKLSGLKKCFFCNSGAEANEAAIKLAKKITGKKKFVVCVGAFHGRTHAALSATWKQAYKDPFIPLVEGFTFVEYDNPEAVENAIGPDTAAVMLEPIQGEAGVIVPAEGYLQKVSEICKRKKVLLILDEVQAGNGRTGKYFAFQHAGIKPDIITTAKGLANGVPIGACISDYEFEKGNHASTFGGNPLACAAANATIDYVLAHNLMENAIEVGGYLMKKLAVLKKVKEVRGKGLMIGVEIAGDAKKAVDECLKNGLVINNTGDGTLRLLPPLIATKQDADEAVRILGKVLEGI
jgi:acetylornithine/N-succinyldiaminopimelate aminotransferase